MSLDTWKHDMEEHINKVMALIDLLPYTGLKECACQKLVLVNALKWLEHGVCVTSESDFYGWTETQKEIITTLRKRKADFTAACCAIAWQAGKEFIFDVHNEARHGLMRKIDRANAEVRARQQKGTT